jgi:hypothetical protein
LALIIFVVSEKAFEHFSIGFKEKYMYCGGGHLGFRIGIKNIKFVDFMSIGNPRWPPPQYID